MLEIIFFIIDDWYLVYFRKLIKIIIDIIILWNIGKYLFNLLYLFIYFFNEKLLGIYVLSNM